MKLNYKIVLISMMLFCAGCSYLISGGDPAVDPGNIGNVEGIVKDVSTGDPISGVTIKVDNISTQTDTNGIYIIKNAGAGDRLITAKKTGYQFYSNTVNIVKGLTTAHNIKMLKIKT